MIGVGAIIRGAFAFISRIPWQLWIIGALLGGGLWYGSARYDAGVLADRGRSDRVLAEYVAEIEAARKQAAADKLAAEAREREQLDAAAATHAKEMTDAQADYDRDVADLRSGAIRLRREWAGCETAALVSGAAAGAGGPDGGAGLRQQGAAHLVRLGAECDADIRGLQAVVRARQ